MDESGIDMGFDLASFLTNDNHVDHILDEMTAAQHQDFMYYELKSKAVPVTERCKQGVKLVGEENLADVPIKKLYMLKHICDKHCKSQD